MQGGTGKPVPRYQPTVFAISAKAGEKPPPRGAYGTGHLLEKHIIYKQYIIRSPGLGKRENGHRVGFPPYRGRRMANAISGMVKMGNAISGIAKMAKTMTNTNTITNTNTMTMREWYILSLSSPPEGIYIFLLPSELCCRGWFQTTTTE